LTVVVSRRESSGWMARAKKVDLEEGAADEELGWCLLRTSFLNPNRQSVLRGTSSTMMRMSMALRGARFVEEIWMD
jgi:hypothetical protein